MTKPQQTIYIQIQLKGTYKLVPLSSEKFMTSKNKIFINLIFKPQNIHAFLSQRKFTTLGPLKKNTPTINNTTTK